MWFAGNAVLPDLSRQFSISGDALGYMISSALLGFICGTLFFAFFNIADRSSPRAIFFACSLLGGVSNLLIYLFPERLAALLVFRFFTGVFLAGIYPVGMKIAAGWYREGLGKALGFLIGALGFGASSPFFVRGMGQSVSWETVIISVSALSLVGGISMLLLVPNGPFMVKGTKFDSRALIVIFQSKGVRSAALGYFGHMWELYGYLVFIPVILANYVAAHPGVDLNIPLWCFWGMSVGSLANIAGGIMADRVGNASVASAQLATSGLCCLLTPWLNCMPVGLFLGVLILWGLTAAGESPQFPTLVARAAPQHLVGSALTAVNCLGFSVTIVSIHMVSGVLPYVGLKYAFLPLSLGPILAVASLWPIVRFERLTVSSSAS